MRRPRAVRCMPLPTHGSTEAVMNELEPVAAHCPYCGEPIELLIDCTIESQRYVEDCQVCCRPIDIIVHVGSDERLPELTLRRQDEA